MGAKKLGDWILRFSKGMLIGTGAILPGVSGGALAAVFGLYEGIIAFLADLRADFRRNFLYFFPVGLGGVFGVFALSFPVSWMLERAEAQVRWFFVGCIVGTLPALWRQAGKRGRGPRHLLGMGIAFALVWALLGGGIGSVNLPRNPVVWLVGGAIIGLGAIVPGLSPSNLLVCLGMYKDMTDAIRLLDPAVLLPLGLGAAGSVLLLSKAVNALLRRAYAGLFHFILGSLLASTLLVIPFGAAYIPGGIGLSVLDGGLGVLLGLWMSRLEEKV